MRIKAYGDSVGPLGFPMKSSIASEVEKLLKEQPNDLKSHFKTDIVNMSGDTISVDGYCRLTPKITPTSIDKDERTDTSYITTAAVDRDFEVVLPSGGNMSQFRKNMVVTFAHAYDALPVGRALWIKREKNVNPDKDGWLALTRYAPKPEGWSGDWFQDAVFHLVSIGDLKGKSIGFIPMEMRAPDEKEIQQRPELASVSYVISKWVLLEYAIATVQSNPTALVRQLTACKGLPSCILKRHGIILPEELPTLEEMLKEDIESENAIERLQKSVANAIEVKKRLDLRKLETLKELIG